MEEVIAGSRHAPPWIKMSQWPRRLGMSLSEGGVVLDGAVGSHISRV